MVKAAVLHEIGAPLSVTEIDLPDPGPGQVRVRLAATGVCHSDLSLSNGTLRQNVPAVLGHEGAGTVVSTGPGAGGVKPGDRVLLNWSPACRACRFCLLDEPHLCEHADDAARTPYAKLADGTPLYAGLGTGAFAEETVVPVAGVVPLPAGLSLNQAAVLGCAVLTGYGAVHNAARVRPGESVVVYGLGGVGLSVLQGARIARAEPVIAVDVSPAKEMLAHLQGATEFVLAGDETARRVRALTGGLGADHAFECVGRPDTIRQAWSSTRRGGQTTIVGIGGPEDKVSFSALELFYFARTLRGCVFGSSDPTRDVPVLAEHIRDGRLRVDDLITDRIELAEIPEAFARMGTGTGGRSLIVF
jgi:S-(hydroxymethyl)glutathione dehydrogenase/alcohol dehydrogenase